jgi:hypothetical protein
VKHKVIARAALFRALFWVVSTAHADGLSCESPFRERFVYLCSPIKCSRNDAAVLPMRGASSNEEPASVIVQGGRSSGKSPTAVFLMSDPHSIFKAGFGLVSLEAPGLADRLLVSGVTERPDAAPFRLRISVLYSR